MRDKAPSTATAKIVTIYALFGLAWIYGSDTVLGWFVHDPAVMVKIAVIKGSLFILCTATLLYYLISHFARQIATAKSRQIESLKGYEAIFNATNEAIFVHDAQSGRILDINDRMLELYGYSRDEALKGDIGQLSEGNAPFTQVEAVEKVRKAMIEGPQVFEWLCRRKTGELFWTEISLRRVSYDHDDRIIAVARDISERKRRDDELRTNEEKHRIILNSAMDGFWHASQQGRLLEVNEAYCRMSGYSKQELLTMCIADLDANETAGDAVMHNQKITQQGEDRFVAQHRRKDGTVFDVEVSAKYVPTADGGLLVGFLRDITDMKRAEEALRESEAHYRSLFDSSLIGVTVTNREFILIDANDAFCKMLEYSKDELIGKLSVADVSHPDDVDESIEMLRRLMAHELDSYSFEKRFLTKTGKTIDGLIYVRGQYNLNGEYEGTTASILDITNLKRAEEERLHLEMQLFHAQKMESLGVLSGGIAHDFNNILAIIIGYCALTKMDYKTAENNILEIEKAAERAAGLCRQMLAYSGKAQLNKTQVNMWMLVDEMLSILKSTLPQNTVIIPDLSSDIPVIEGDASQLRQIVMNLIINASEAIGKVQGEVRVSLATTTVIAGHSDKDYHGKSIPSGEYVCLEVTDNGCGMDEETIRRIFEPFYTTKFTGRGLGMSAVLGIITSHNGALQLYSQLGQGTTFKVYLPVQTTCSAVDENFKLPIPTEAWQGSGTILLVEDEDQVRFIAKAMLENFGFAVLEAVNGKEALELYQKNAADISVVITDMGMPVMDGYELFSELNKLNPELPIIISSGFGDAEISSRIAIDDSAGLVSKPYHPDQLREVLKSVLEGVHPARA